MTGSLLLELGTEAQKVESGEYLTAEEFIKENHYQGRREYENSN